MQVTTSTGNDPASDNNPVSPQFRNPANSQLIDASKAADHLAQAALHATNALRVGVLPILGLAHPAPDPSQLSIVGAREAKQIDLHLEALSNSTAELGAPLTSQAAPTIAGEISKILEELPGKLQQAATIEIDKYRKERDNLIGKLTEEGIPASALPALRPTDKIVQELFKDEDLKYPALDNPDISALALQIRAATVIRSIEATYQNLNQTLQNALRTDQQGLASTAVQAISAQLSQAVLALVETEKSDLSPLEQAKLALDAIRDSKILGPRASTKNAVVSTDEAAARIALDSTCAALGAVFGVMEAARFDYPLTTGTASKLRSTTEEAAAIGLSAPDSIYYLGIMLAQGSEIQQLRALRSSAELMLDADSSAGSATRPFNQLYAGHRSGHILTMNVSAPTEDDQRRAIEIRERSASVAALGLDSNFSQVKAASLTTLVGFGPEGVSALLQAYREGKINDEEILHGLKMIDNAGTAFAGRTNQGQQRIDHARKAAFDFAISLLEQSIDRTEPNGEALVVACMYAPKVDGNDREVAAPAKVTIKDLWSKTSNQAAYDHLLLQDYGIDILR